MSSGVHPAPFGARSAFPLSRSESRLHKDPKLAGAIRMATPKTRRSSRQVGPAGSAKDDDSPEFAASKSSILTGR